MSHNLPAKHPKAAGDYYFDRSRAHTSRAHAININNQTAPYHYKVEAGQIPPNAKDCILIIGEPGTSHSGAIELPECEFAPAGAILYFNEFMQRR